MTNYPNITADDWGMTPAINDGILELARQGTVRRVSMLADSPFVQHRLKELLELDSVSLGLHFDLTLKNRKDSQNPFDFGRATKLILNPLVSSEKKSQIFEKEALRQIEVLKKLGVFLNYLDGHQHLHLLPFAARGIARAMKKAQIEKVRNPYSKALWKTPKFPINLLAVLGIRPYRRQGIDSYACRYPQQESFASPEALKRFLEEAPDAEVIVHPALKDDFVEVGCQDSYREGRIREYLALSNLKGRK